MLIFLMLSGDSAIGSGGAILEDGVQKWDFLTGLETRFK
jgi:hypothetical protein